MVSNVIWNALLLILSLLSDPELKLTFSILPTNCLNLSVVICAPQCKNVLQQCFCNNVSVHNL